MVLLLLEALSHIGVVVIFLIAVFLVSGIYHSLGIFHSCGICHFCRICHSCGIGVFRLLAGCIGFDNGLILICGHSCDGAIIVLTIRVDYNVHVVIVIGFNIGGILLSVCVIVPASVIIITIVVIICIIFYRNAFLIVVAVVWICVGNFMLQSVNYFQSYGMIVARASVPVCEY